MNPKIIAICRVALAAFLGALMPSLITIGDPVLPIILMVGGIILTWVLVRKDRRTLVDERAQLISQKASATSLAVFLVGTALMGVVLVTLGNGGYPDFSPMGYTLMYSVCGLLMLNLLFGVYYRRKYGG
ncbi:MAG: DUF2178 domain-containing protein [Candidatus Bathyarchaeota archaeon]|nr:DUF2178 domain-containing protein [Candidatus Bathyarchaeum sp.]